MNAESRTHNSIDSVSRPDVRALADVSGSLQGVAAQLPSEQGQPVFVEPWHAQVFAIAMKLHEQGYFEWPEWSNMLGEEILKAQAAGDLDLGDTYYNHWLNTLERMICAKGLGAEEELTDLQQRWEQAALATPHGQPINIDY